MANGKTPESPPPPSYLLQAIRARTMPPIPPEEKPPNAADALEAELAEELKQYKPRARILNNSQELHNARELLTNAITDAHADTCRTIDKRMEEVRNMMSRLEKFAESRKAKLQEDGQEIAQKIEAVMQNLTRDVEWLEKTGSSVRNLEYKPQPPQTEPQSES